MDSATIPCMHFWTSEGACVIGNRKYVMAIVDQLYNAAIISGWWWDTLGFVLPIKERTVRDILRRGL